MILGKNIGNVYSRGNEIQRVFSYGKLVWEKKADDYNGVVFMAEQENSTIGLAKLSTNQTLEYRTDNTNWQNMTRDTVITLNNIGDRAYIRGELSADNSTSNYTQFTMNGLISASGNCNYIWSKNDLDAPLKEFCGYKLFYVCPITQAPELPATTLAVSCYRSMFYRCSSLTKAPELPATTLANNCYHSMFYWCSSLTKAPELPATTLANNCYMTMFERCSSLTQAPVLPATTLTNKCYMAMFRYCEKLNYVKCLATDISAFRCTNSWLVSVSETGTFVQVDGVNWSVGGSGIPEGWVVEVEDFNGVIFTAEEVNSTIGLAELSTNQTLEYRTDYTNWQEMTLDTVISLNNIGDRAYIRGELLADNTESDYTQFTMTGLISASGNCNYIWSKNDLDAPLKAFCGCGMFDYCTSLTQAPELPATTLATGCYSEMFAYTPITQAPELPAKELAPYCYMSMFERCSSLTQAPELPAKELADGCYTSMFYECTSLTRVSPLPATTLVYGCYMSMFNKCTSLTQAPELPATTLADNCYLSMFAYTPITQAPELPATELAEGCYYNMFAYCTSLTRVSPLPATTLVKNCYKGMFSYCEKLNYIYSIATYISATDCTNNWLMGVSETGKFIAKKGTNWTRDVSGIPENWTVQYI